MTCLSGYCIHVCIPQASTHRLAQRRMSNACSVHVAAVFIQRAYTLSPTCAIQQRIVRSKHCRSQPVSSFRHCYNILFSLLTVGLVHFTCTVHSSTPGLPALFPTKQNSLVFRLLRSSCRLLYCIYLTNHLSMYVPNLANHFLDARLEFGDIFSSLISILS